MPCCGLRGKNVTKAKNTAKTKLHRDKTDQIFWKGMLPVLFIFFKSTTTWNRVQLNFAGFIEV